MKDALLDRVDGERLISLLEASYDNGGPRKTWDGGLFQSDVERIIRKFFATNRGLDEEKHELAMH